MKEIDNALANGQLIRISYGKDNNDLERGHAAIITKAHYDADGNVTSYDLFHGWDIASIGAHADNLTVARLGETIRAAQKVTLPRTLKELL